MKSFPDFKQDPDVLDTWFSSALWPHSTLGWPERTAELAKWYPTSVLVTSRDIITLWVARMVMMGIYNMGGGQFLAENAEEARLQIANLKLQIANSIPFRDVHIHPTILDAKGERMSKTKGNGVDPVDVISTHGADALRFTLTQMATETQDAKMRVQLVCPHCGNQFDNPEGKSPAVICPKCKKPMTRPMGTATGTPEAPLARATSDRFDVGKHFCNKIWQVTQHFAMANLEKIAAEETDQSKWSLADRWIISRFARTLEAANTAIATYRFDQYAKACYDFFWGDFCDWYVEAIKPALKDPSRAGQTANVLAAMIDGALRLMHPMIPFITEVLFWRLNELRPERSLDGSVKLPAGQRLIKAAWPTAEVLNDESESQFARLKEMIVAIRNLRTQSGIKPSQSVSVWIGAPEPVLGTINDNRELIELLATCAIKDVRAEMSAPPNSTHVTAAGCDLYVEGLVDPEAEKQLRAKKEADLERQITALKGRLSNEAYIAKAPAHLVQQTKDQLAAAEAELSKLG
jgi:valyl-tRNA synthetase